MAGSWTHCAQCQEGIWLTADREEMLRRSSQGFHCLWGHPNLFPQGESEAGKLRRERDRLKQQTARLEEEKRVAWNTATRERENREAAERRASAARGQVTKLKNRAANGVCPCCNRTFANLQQHMATKHAGFLAEEVQGAVGATLQ